MFKPVESYGERISTRKGRPCVLTITTHHSLYFAPLRDSKQSGVVLETHWDNSIKASIICQGEGKCLECSKRGPIPKMYLAVFALWNAYSAIESTPRLSDQLVNPPASFGRVGILEVTQGLMDLWTSFAQGVWYKGYKAKPIANARCLIKPVPSFPQVDDSHPAFAGEPVDAAAVVRACYGVRDSQ